MDRLNQLKQFVAEEPNDPFNLYALALEYLKTDTTQACVLFEKLTQIHPKYLPTYYPYAQQLIERRNPEKAESIFLHGIEIAKSNNDGKTLKELQGAYQDWMYERM